MQNNTITVVTNLSYGRATSQKKAYKSNNHIGYKGFIEKGYYLLPQDWFSTAIEITTSNGYQLSPIFYTGLGTGAGVSYGYNHISLSLQI